MNCREFEDRIEDIAADALPEGDRDEMMCHARHCERCSRFLAIVRGEAETLAAAAQDPLTRAIMFRTAGPACTGAQDRLCGWIDGDAAPLDQEMIAAHVTHCADCQKMAATLVELNGILPGITDMDPGDGFTAHVLRATSQSRIAPRLHRPAIKSAWWHDLLRRPRFAWEAAYVGSLLILLILGNPSIRMKTNALPEIVADGGNQILQETTEVISNRQAEARQSINFLGQKSKTWLRQAAGLPGRTGSTLRDMAISFVQDLKLEMRADEAPRDLR